MISRRFHLSPHINMKISTFLTRWRCHDSNYGQIVHKLCFRHSSHYINYVEGQNTYRTSALLTIYQGAFAGIEWFSFHGFRRNRPRLYGSTISHQSSPAGPKILIIFAFKAFSVSASRGRSAKAFHIRRWFSSIPLDARFMSLSIFIGVRFNMRVSPRDVLFSLATWHFPDILPFRARSFYIGPPETYWDLSSPMGIYSPGGKRASTNISLSLSLCLRLWWLRLLPFW